MNDFEFQVRFVVSAVPRLVSQIDLDPLSPTYGCSHLAFWRDKTSEFADARRQESMLAFSMLYRAEFPGSSWTGNRRLLDVVVAQLSYWMAMQYPDGALDEWYKGERAYAAPAYAAHCVARTLLAVGRFLPPDVVAKVKQRLEVTARWLETHDDFFKTNHQVTGACALAFCAQALDAPRLAAVARSTLASVLGSQTHEGWFPEVRAMDPGYTFLTVEFAAMAMAELGWWEHASAFARAMDFACAWTHPGPILGDEYGICHNPYVSRIAAVLMADRSDGAASLLEVLLSGSAGMSGLTPTLTDDLRLPRWSFQPLAAWEYLKLSPGLRPGAQKLPLFGTGQPAKVYGLSGLARVSAGGRPAVMCSRAGGLVRLFGPSGPEITDLGYALRIPDGWATCQTYNPRIRIEEIGGKISCTCGINPAKRFQPSFSARLALRLACTTAVGARLARKGIDLIRGRLGTAVNQSSANLMAASGNTMRRTLEATPEGAVLLDRLSFTRPVRPQDLFACIRRGDGPTVLEPLTALAPSPGESVSGVTVMRRYGPDPTWREHEATLAWG